MSKKRKPRTTGYDIDFDGTHLNGQPVYKDTPAMKKLYDRFVNKLCLGCGKPTQSPTDPNITCCSCKSHWVEGTKFKSHKG